MQCRVRTAVLLANGVIYTTWATRYDTRPYTGWIIDYDESTLTQCSECDVQCAPEMEHPAKPVLLFPSVCCTIDLGIFTIQCLKESYAITD